ncbi:MULTISPECIES: GGDEF domain-containing protein [Pseudoalteromonas]|uniref:diguanylate cyclase n=1 Tax=Pseudoalteromonas lipolytica TaxID=570156 RepID=A0AAD0RYP3_9GAMM|nr:MULTISPECIES: GGDEF domain-containing protein [Pseudoalteromonas]AXV64816.1 GGDEF domain-containing protein [Pseudoalteromonas donghaensis]MAE02050.1 GGDEF domain-containing protein [Pseudoalteromonas sp.]QPL43911.1 GGDEF domain-containing protein [Pseudoalteromonas sp. A41-2]|tara:strand:+ start:4386 stop:5282 length:897 start_codon:yes stop_codon:yes gene_type:complete
MENVHILTQRVTARGDFMPFSAERYRISEQHNTHDLVTKLQTTLSIEGILTIFAEHAKQLINLSGLQFQSALGVSESVDSDTTHTPYSFDLDLESERLGQLIYFSQFPMGQAIETKLQQLHAALVYPLRNAIMYTRVLRLATKDALTGLNNRSQFNDSLAQRLERCRRQHRPFSLMLLDLDNFKQVNDNFGHKIGDDVLQEFANVLRNCVRGTDSIFRFGGDEFALLIDDPEFTTNKVIADRVMRLVSQSSLMAQYAVTSSIGFTLANNQDCENEVFARADKGLYRAKAAGRNCAKAY